MDSENPTNNKLREFGQWLLGRIKDKGSNQNRVAIATGLTPAHMSKIVNGKGGVSDDALVKIADAIKVPRKELLDAWIDYRAAAGEVPPYEPYRSNLGDGLTLEYVGDTPPVVTEQDKKFIRTYVKVNQVTRSGSGATPNNDVSGVQPEDEVRTGG